MVTEEAVVLTDGFAAVLHSLQGESRCVTSEAGAHARTFMEPTGLKGDAHQVPAVALLLTGCVAVGS